MLTYQADIGDGRFGPELACTGGLRREHAVNLLRRFYVQDNPHAPDPRRKTGRELRLLPEAHEEEEEDEEASGGND